MNQEKHLLALKDNFEDLDLKNFFTLTYCLINEFYQSLQYLTVRLSQNPFISDSKVIGLNLVGQAERLSMIFDF